MEESEECKECIEKLTDKKAVVLTDKTIKAGHEMHKKIIKLKAEKVLDDVNKNFQSCPKCKQDK